MAAPLLFRCSRGFISKLRTGSCYSSSSADVATNPLKDGILPYLCNRFYDIEAFVEFGTKLKKWNQHRKNQYYAEAHERYGNDLGAAIFVLSLKGSIRFQGQEWYRETKRWKKMHRFLDCQDLPLEAIDVSGSIINYEGLNNLVNLKALKYLDLSRCANIDDWSLSRLHVFEDTLQELSLAGCPQITERGLGTLHHLVNLQRLDISSLPSVSNKGLVRILLEEMLPKCDIVGMDYTEGLLPYPELDVLEGETEELQKLPCKQKSSEIPA